MTSPVRPTAQRSLSLSCRPASWTATWWRRSSGAIAKLRPQGRFLPCQLIERRLCLFDAHRQLARPLERGGDVVVVVAEIGTFAGGFELHGKRLEPLAGGDLVLLRNFAGVLGALISGV